MAAPSPRELRRRARQVTGHGNDGGRRQRPRRGRTAGGGVRAAAADRVGRLLAGVAGAAPGAGHGGGGEGDRHGASQQQAPREPALRGRHPPSHPT